MSSASSKPAASAATVSPVKVPWHPLWAVLYGLGLFFVVQQLAGLIVTIYPLAQHWSRLRTEQWVASIPVQFVYTLLAEGLVVAGLFWFVRRYKTTFAALGLSRPQGRDAGLLFGGFAIYFVIYGLLLSILPHFIPALNVTQKQDIGFNGAAGFGPLALTFVSLVILPPFVEELLMRGFLFTSLRKRLSFGVSTLIISLIFASGHLPEGGAAGPLWVGAIDTFVLSLVLCYLREKTGRLWAGIGVHALKNGLAFISLYLLHLAG